LVELIIAGITAAPHLYEAGVKIVELLMKNRELTDAEWDAWLAFVAGRMQQPQWQSGQK
jgi:hypothetical protein